MEAYKTEQHSYSKPIRHTTHIYKKKYDAAFNTNNQNSGIEPNTLTENIERSNPEDENHSHIKKWMLRECHEENNENTTTEHGDREINESKRRLTYRLTLLELRTKTQFRITYHSSENCEQTGSFTPWLRT